MKLAPKNSKEKNKYAIVEKMYESNASNNNNSQTEKKPMVLC